MSTPCHFDETPRSGPDGTPRRHPSPPEKLPEDSPPPMTMLVVVLVLLVGGWFLANKLVESSRLQDCMMSGRRNCVTIDTGGQ